MNKLNKGLWKITGIGFVFVILALIQEEFDNWLRMSEQQQLLLNSAYLNLGCGLIGSVAVIFLYNRVQDNIREQETIAKRKVAVERMHKTLNATLEALVTMYWATTGGRERLENNTIESFFDEAYFHAATKLDFGKSLYPESSGFHETTWLTIFPDRINHLVQEADKVTWKYAECLEQDILGLLESLDTLQFVKWVQGLPEDFIRYESFPYQMAAFYPGRMDGMVPESFKKFVEVFVGVVKYYNRWADADKQIEFNEGLRKVEPSLLSDEQLEFQKESVTKAIEWRKRSTAT